MHGSVASRSLQTGASYPQPTCAPIDRLEVVLRKQPIAGGKRSRRMGVHDQFARLSRAPPVIEEMTPSTPPVRSLRRSQVRAKGSRLRHAPAQPCIRDTV